MSTDGNKDKEGASLIAKVIFLLSLLLLMYVITYILFSLNGKYSSGIIVRSGPKIGYMTIDVIWWVPSNMNSFTEVFFCPLIWADRSFFHNQPDLL